jgi:hypothetical protein
MNDTPQPLYPRERDPVPILQKVVWAQGKVRMGTEKLATPGIDPRTVQPITSPYGLDYTGPLVVYEQLLCPCAL